MNPLDLIRHARWVRRQRRRRAAFLASHGGRQTIDLPRRNFPTLTTKKPSRRGNG